MHWRWVLENHCGEGEVKISQSCLTLCDPLVYTVHGILQDTGVGSHFLLQGKPVQMSVSFLLPLDKDILPKSSRKSPRKDALNYDLIYSNANCRLAVYTITILNKCNFLLEAERSPQQEDCSKCGNVIKL